MTAAPIPSPFTAPWTFESWLGDFEPATWALWPFGMDRDEIRKREPWFAFIDAHELGRRWTDLPNWLTASARIHERLPLWILDHLHRIGVPFEDVDRYLDSETLPFASPNRLMLALTFADPVRFGETQFLMPNKYWRMTRYWAFQKAWMRLRPMRVEVNRPEDVSTLKVIQCSGFGIGKTVRLCHRALFKVLVERVDALLGAPEASHVFTMFNIVKNTVEKNPLLRKRCPEILKSEAGFPILRTSRGQTLYFRWADADGDSFRSIHLVGGYAAVDEAAKLKGDLDTQIENLANFVSRVEAGLVDGKLQGGELHLGSVPDGRRLLFFKHSENAVPLDLWQPEPTYGEWNLWRESKSLQPAPFNTPARRAELAKEWDGEHSPKFLQNWHGLHGTSTEGLWPAEVLLPCLEAVDGYQGATLRLEKGVEKGLVSWRSYRLDPHYDPQAGLKSAGAGRRTSALQPTITLAEDRLPLDPYLPRHPKRDSPQDQDRRSTEWRDFLAELFVCPHGELAAGVDIGESDPTEITVARVVDGSPREVVLRLQLIGMPHGIQADLLYALADLLNPIWGWGFDATGGPALLTMIYQERLVHERPVRLGRRGLDVTEVVMHKNRELLPEIESKGDTSDKVLVSSKHLAVCLLDMAIRGRSVALPWDPIVIKELPAFERQRLPAGSWKYTGTHDHFVASLLCLFLHVRLTRELLTDEDVEPESLPRTEFDEDLTAFGDLL